jgi:hypothetical protein
VVTQAARRVDGWLTDIPFYPWLVAAFPVVRLYQENLTDVAPADVVLPLLLVLGVATIGMLLLSRLLHDARRAAIVVAAVLVPVLSFGLFLELLPAALERARYLLLGLTIAGVVVAIIVALRVSRGLLGTITSGLNILSLVLVVVVAIPALQGAADALRLGAAPFEDPAPEVVFPEGATAGRDIYHLILDRYGSERSLRTGYRYDNAEFIAWLREQGFQVLDDARANYTWTTLSMASTLGMSHLDDIAAASGPGSRNMAPVDRRLSENPAGALLQDLGYRYIHLAAWFEPTRDSAIADEVYHPAQEVDFASMLTDLSIVPTLQGGGTAAERGENGRHASAVRYEIEQLDRIREEPGPKYVLAHIFLPHPPYTFLEDGTVDPDKATFHSQLTFANSFLRQFLEPLLALPEEERPIIILQADEGPYPRRIARDPIAFDWDTVTDEELITKFGILDAWLMPGPEGEAPLPQDQTAINTYPELFRRYFGAEVADAPDRTYASPKDQPYDLTDITDRLDEAERRQIERTQLGDVAATAEPTASLATAEASALASPATAVPTAPTEATAPATPSPTAGAS